MPKSSKLRDWTQDLQDSVSDYYRTAIKLAPQGEKRHQQNESPD
jgi:hypothetical protein